MLWTFPLTNILRKTQFGANNVEDMVEIRLGNTFPVVPYQIGFEIASRLRMGAKAAATFDKAPSTFWRQVSMGDLEDCPSPNRNFRRSNQVSNVTLWKVAHNKNLVAIIFDEVGVTFGYEEAIKLHQIIRRASRRAKAWAGDTTTTSRVLCNLTAEAV